MEEPDPRLSEDPASHHPLPERRGCRCSGLLWAPARVAAAHQTTSSQTTEPQSRNSRSLPATAGLRSSLSVSRSI